MKRSAESFHLWEGELLRIYSSKIFDFITITSYIQADLPLSFFASSLAAYFLLNLSTRPAVSIIF